MFVDRSEDISSKVAVWQVHKGSKLPDNCHQRSNILQQKTSTVTNNQLLQVFFNSTIITSYKTLFKISGAKIFRFSQLYHEYCWNATIY